MTKSSVEQIIGRMITDEAFRKAFFKDPAQALEGYELSEEELAALLATKVEDVEGFSRKLDERITKGKILF
ncbi:MAG: Franean1_4349 family RiPP [Thermoflexales bacterium]|nr:Franean1_4349 family RiPP [Thermoflexales bacterium]